MELERSGPSGLTVVLEDGARSVVSGAQINTYAPGANDYSGVWGYWTEASLHRDASVLYVHVVEVTEHEGGIDRRTAGSFRSVDSGKTWSRENAAVEPGPAVATLSTAQSELPVVGDYRLIRRLGRGCLGELQQAFDPNTEAVALRILRSPEDAEVRARVAALAQRLPYLRHPNLVPVHAISTLADGRILVTSEYFASKRTLESVLEEGPIESSRARDIACAMLAGLEALHGAGLVHGDVQPRNVFFAGAHWEPPRPPMLADAGLLIALDGGVRTHGSVRTEIAYLPSESLGTLAIDSSTDVYGVGACLYEMLARRRPFEAPSKFALATAIAMQQPPALTTFTSAPQALTAIVERAMSKDRAARYPSAAAMREALEASDLGRAPQP